MPRTLLSLLILIALLTSPTLAAEKPATPQEAFKMFKRAFLDADGDALAALCKGSDAEKKLFKLSCVFEATSIKFVEMMEATYGKGATKNIDGWSGDPAVMAKESKKKIMNESDYVFKVNGDGKTATASLDDEEVMEFVKEDGGWLVVAPKNENMSDEMAVVMMKLGGELIKIMKKEMENIGKEGVSAEKIRDSYNKKTNDLMNAMLDDILDAERSPAEEQMFNVSPFSTRTTLSENDFDKKYVKPIVEAIQSPAAKKWELLLPQPRQLQDIAEHRIGAYEQGEGWRRGSAVGRPEEYPEWKVFQQIAHNKGVDEAKRISALAKRGIAECSAFLKNATVSIGQDCSVNISYIGSGLHSRFDTDAGEKDLDLVIPITTYHLSAYVITVTQKKDDIVSAFQFEIRGDYALKGKDVVFYPTYILPIAAIEAKKTEVNIWTVNDASHNILRIEPPYNYTFMFSGKYDRNSLSLQRHYPKEAFADPPAEVFPPGIMHYKLSRNGATPSLTQLLALFNYYDVYKDATYLQVAKKSIEQGASIEVPKTSKLFLEIADRLRVTQKDLGILKRLLETDSEYQKQKIRETPLRNNLKLVEFTIRANKKPDGLLRTPPIEDN